MADGNNGALYAVIGAVAIAVIGGGVYLMKDSRTETAAPPPVTTPAPAPPVAAAPPPAPPRAPATPAPAPPAAQPDQVQALLGDARRLITRGDYAAADRALDQAERLAPNSSEVAAARRDLREAQRNTARRDNRIDNLVAQARAAIARRDYAAADRALDEAERIDGRDRDVQQTREELAQAQRPAPNRPAPDRDRDGRPDAPRR
jgi:tetratricopeptide (TPR) repeat protein